MAMQFKDFKSNPSSQLHVYVGAMDVSIPVQYVAFPHWLEHSLTMQEVSNYFQEK